MNEENALKVIDRREERTPAQDALMVAIRQGDRETIKMLVDLRRQEEADHARKAYHLAMSKFHADPPKVFKTGKADFSGRTGGKVSYSYAELARAAEEIQKKLSAHGLSASWRTEQLESGAIKVTCFITHELGHSESTFLQAKADETGSKNPIQAIGSTISYLERYTLFAMAGIAPEGMDDDGHGSTNDSEPITPEQTAQLTTLIKKAYKTEEYQNKFLEWVKAETGAETVDAIPAGDFRKVETALNQRIAKAKK